MTAINRTGQRCFFLFLLFASFTSAAQLSRLDSLKRDITNAASEAGKLQATLAFCEEWESFNPDTLQKYALIARRGALVKKNEPALLLSDYYLAAYLFQKNRIDSALTAIDSIIIRARRISSYNSTLLKCWFLRGNILLRSSHYDELLKQNYFVLGLAEQQHDTIALIRMNTSIGNVNMRLKKNAEALKWHYRAIALMRNDRVRASCSFVFVNIAVAYYHQAVLNDTKENEDSIEINLERAILYSRKGNSLTNLANSLSMYGNTLAEYKKLTSAEAALTEALTIRKKIGDVFYEIVDMASLSSFYQNSNNFPKAIAVSLEALNLANKYGDDFISRSTIYSSLGEIYARSGDFKKYSEVLNIRMQLQDSFYKFNTAEAISEMETKYEVQKKENIIIQQKYDLVKKNYLFYGSLLLLLLGGAFSIILFRQYRKKQKMRMQLLHEEEKRISLIAVADAEENERRRIAAELHDNLGSQLSYISSNMDLMIDTPGQLQAEEKDKRMGRVNETVKNAITDLRGTIWALKKESVEIEEIADKLKLHALDQLSHKQGMKLDVQENLPVRIILSPSEALNIFRIFQEAISNAIKYSGAEAINLSLETDLPAAFRISVSDNGQGFDTQKNYPDHYGLENMKERATEINAVLVISSEQGKGTRVALSKG